jgi:hypothetical protein
VSRQAERGYFRRIAAESVAHARKQEPMTWPVTCWRCQRPALEDRAVCTVHADELERKGARLRAQATKGHKQ